MSTPLRIAVLIGSTRKGSNGLGIASWVSSAIAQRAAAHASHTTHAVEVVPVDLTSTSYALGPLVDALVPAGVKDVTDYAPPVQNWSKFVTSCSGFVVVSPQYNWGYPGELKNALDHLFNEWNAKPVAVVTYGGRGGGKAGQQLREVLQGGLRMTLVENKVEISLPRPYISTDLRVSTTASVALHGTPEDKDAFLADFVKPLEEALDALLDVSAAPKVEAQAA